MRREEKEIGKLQKKKNEWKKVIECSNLKLCKQDTQQEA